MQTTRQKAGRLPQSGKSDGNHRPPVSQTTSIAPPEGIEPSLPRLRDRGPASTGGGYRRSRGPRSLAEMKLVVWRYFVYVNSFLNSFQPRVLATCSALSQARRAVATA